MCFCVILILSQTIEILYYSFFVLVPHYNEVNAWICYSVQDVVRSVAQLKDKRYLISDVNAQSDASFQAAQLEFHFSLIFMAHSRPLAFTPQVLRVVERIMSSNA